MNKITADAAPNSSIGTDIEGGEITDDVVQDMTNDASEIDPNDDSLASTPAGDKNLLAKTAADDAAAMASAASIMCALIIDAKYNNFCYF